MAHRAELFEVEASLKKASDAVANWLVRRVEGIDPEPPPAREAELPRDWPEKLPYRKRPKPYSRAVSWTPATGGNRHDRSRAFELFVSQPVLGEVRQHLITATSGEPFGFLLGQVVHCPWTSAPYIVIDSVRRETQDLPPANDLDRFRHAWIAAGRDARRRRGEVIGWYHRHGVLGLNLSEWDLRLQEEFFPEPWHCALVVASSEHGIIGGFIQRSRRARLFRRGLAPFHELVDIDAKLVNGLKPSVIDWANYVAGENVSVIRAEWPKTAVRKKTWKSPDHAEGTDLPTPETAAPAPVSRSLGGRRWRTGAAQEVTRPAARSSPAPTREGFTDDFADAVGSAAGAPVWEAEVAERTVDPAGRASTPAKSEPHKPPAQKKEAARARPGGGKKKQAAPDSKGAGGGSSRAARQKGPPPTVEEDIDEAWYSSEFRDAVWGPAPFEPESTEPSTVEPESHARTRSVPARPPEEGGQPKPPATSEAVDRKPRFELLPAMEPEPPEIDRPSSLEWLLSVVGGSLAGLAAGSTSGAEGAGDESADGEGASDESRPEAAELEVAAAEAAESEAAPDVAVPVGAPEPETVPEGPAGETGGDELVPVPRPPDRTRRPMRAPTSGGVTFVSPSTHPDSDPEAAILVVLPTELPSPHRSTRRRAIASVVILLAVTAAVRLAIGGQTSAGAAGRPTVPALAPPAQVQNAPSTEFVRLADGYLTALQSYRERTVEHQTGQADCDALGSEFSVLAASHAEIAAYVQHAPSIQDRFDTLTREFVDARARFEASGCPVPPGVVSDPVPSPAGESLR